MTRFFSWIKNNKLTTLLLLVVFYFLFRNMFGAFLGVSLSRPLKQQSTGAISSLGQSPAAFSELSAGRLGLPILPPSQEAAPTTDVDERLVVRETNLSLLVEDVRVTSEDVVSYVEGMGGYMVNSSITQPEEAPFATIVVRVPSEKLREAMEHFRSLAIKVSSEYITGRDVTDQYVDIESRLETLEKTKARFEEIMDKAVEINDILRVQREIISLQSQIDSLKGQQQLLQGSARLSRVTISMSTDEIALPYTPSEVFRPSVILKLAWRSLIRNLRKVATAALWIGVYSVIWLPTLGAILYVKRWMTKKKSQQQ